MHFLKICRNQWDRTLGIVLVVSGFVALLVGWLSVQDMIFTFEQVPYVISGGLLGVALIGVGCASWVSADLRDEWRKLDDLQAAVEALTAGESEALVLSDTDRSTAPSNASASRPEAKVSGAS